MLKTIAALGAAFLLAACAGTPVDQALTKNTGLTVQQRCATYTMALAMADAVYQAARTDEARSAKEIETHQATVVAMRAALNTCMTQPTLTVAPTPAPSKPE